MTAEMKLDGQRYDFVVDDMVYGSSGDEVTVPLLLICRNQGDAEIRRIGVRFFCPDSQAWHNRMSEGARAAARVGSECILALLAGDDLIRPYCDESALTGIMPYTCECVGREVWNAAVSFDREWRESNREEKPNEE